MLGFVRDVTVLLNLIDKVFMKLLVDLHELSRVSLLLLHLVVVPNAGDQVLNLWGQLPRLNVFSLLKLALLVQLCLDFLQLMDLCVFVYMLVLSRWLNHHIVEFLTV